MFDLIVTTEYLKAAIDPFTAMMVFSMGSQLIGGIMGGRKQERARQMEAEITRQNAARQADRILDEELHQMGGAQRVAYAKAGVLMEGSPFIVAQTTARRIAQDATDIRREGERQAQFLTQMGRIERQNALMGGIFGAAQGGVQAWGQSQIINQLRGPGTDDGMMPAGNIPGPFTMA